MHLKVWAAVCHPDFSELLFQGIFTFIVGNDQEMDNQKDIPTPKERDGEKQN